MTKVKVRCSRYEGVSTTLVLPQHGGGGGGEEEEEEEEFT